MSTTILGWAWFVVAQLIMLVATIVGAVLVLPIACALKAWTSCDPCTLSIKIAPNGNRMCVDRWRWRWINAVWGNPEDGVSGGTAWIWVTSITVRVYNPAETRWLAYCWNIRNSANQLTYTFGKLVISEPPPYYAGKYFHAGWKMYGAYRRIVLGRNS